MENKKIHISWNEITTTCTKLFCGIAMDLGHAEEASVAISTMEAQSGDGLKYLRKIYTKILPIKNQTLNFVIKKPHLLVVDANGQTIFNIIEVIDFIVAHCTKHGYVLSCIYNFKHENILPYFLYKDYVMDIKLSAQILSNKFFTVIQNTQTFNNVQVSQYSIPNSMETEKMTAIYACDSKHFNSFNFHPTKPPNYILTSGALAQKLLFAQTKGLAVNKETWDWVVKQSKKILVPESDKSKSQAG
ncbi:MAG: DUF3726 domain-containing protein [Tenacibaculum sp.]